MQFSIIYSYKIVSKYQNQITKKAMKRKGPQVRAGGRCTFRQGRTLELLLAVSGREGSAERPQVPTLRLVHEVEELPEHLHRQRPEGHFRHKQPNAESAC